MTDDPAAHVYDLDGTLVRLAVDWEAAAADVAAVFGDAGIDVAQGADVWTLLERAAEHELTDAVEETLSAHERDGAERSTRLPAADDLRARSTPAAVCSLNSEAACRIALQRHGLLGEVETVIGRDSVEARKPDPEPLLAAIRPLSADPSETLFVGDSKSDAVTAERAGTRFAYVDGAPDGH